MQFLKLDIGLTRSITLSDGRVESITITYQVELQKDEDDPQEAYTHVYRIINLQLNSWERELRQETEKKMFLSTDPPPITTAASMIENSNKPEFANQDILCPKCNNKMKQKDGKTYYTCPNSHWGYLEMIKKGEVR